MYTHEYIIASTHMKPVDSAATDKRREHSEPAPEGISNGTHGQDNVEVLPHSLNEEVVHGQRSCLYLATLSTSEHH